MIQSKISVLSLLVILCGLFQIEFALAEDSNEDVRPSFLLNVETGGTLNSNQLVGSAFGVSGARVSYGITKDLEARADVSLNSIIAPSSLTNTSFGDGLTVKYHLFDVSVVRVAAKGQVFVAGTNSNSLTTGLGAIAIDASLGPVLMTIIPRASFTAGSNVFGADYGLAIPIISVLDLIGELSLSTSLGVNTLGGVGGVVFKPYKTVTVPVVLVQNGGANAMGAMNTAATTNVGFLAIFAHVGFQL